jgi:hypothetical protein
MGKASRSAAPAISPAGLDGLSAAAKRKPPPGLRSATDSYAGVVHTPWALSRHPVSAEGTDPPEREVNAFATELLMPKKLLAAALDDRMVDLDNDRLIALAKHFKVSLTALQYRLQGGCDVHSL